MNRRKPGGFPKEPVRTFERTHGRHTARVATIHSLLADIRETSLSQREKGDRFERLMRAYMRADPMYAKLFSEVWLWSEWPGNDGKVDTGIDLVAQERDGAGCCAIQCKFYAPDHRLQKQDIDSFFTASGKAPFTSRLIISTTDKWSTNAEDALSQQQIPVTRIGMAEIEQSSVCWDLVWPAAPDAASLDDQHVVPSMYRPYCKQWLYFDRQFNERVLLVPKLFPTPRHGNIVIAMNGVGVNRPFSALITDVIPNRHLQDTGQCFPLYYYEPTDNDRYAVR